MTKIIIEIAGGNIVGVHSDSEDFRYAILDWDNRIIGEPADKYQEYEPDSTTNDIEKRYKLLAEGSDLF